MCKMSQTMTRLVQMNSTRPVRASCNGKARVRTTMPPEVLVVLSHQDNRTLAQWWCTLNSWSWPDELECPEVTEFMQDGRRSRIMRWIEAAIGIKECLREWNRGSMDDEVFKDFWRGTFEGAHEARQKFMAWLSDEQSHYTLERRSQPKAAGRRTADTAINRLTVSQRFNLIRNERGE